MKIALSIVVPAYAEEALIGSSLDTIRDFLDEQAIADKTEVIVVSADSDDRTHEIVANKLGTFTHSQFVQPGPRVGKGRDVRVGVQAARGEYILFTDADLATPLSYIPQTVKLLAGDADVVIGVRDLSTVHEGFRYYLSNLSNILIQLVLLPGVKDSQCGYKAFTSSAAQRIFERATVNGWGFDMEVLKIAREHKFAIAEIAVPDWADPKLEDSLVGDSPAGAMIKTLKELWQIRVKSWKGQYK